MGARSDVSKSNDGTGRTWVTSSSHDTGNPLKQKAHLPYCLQGHHTTAPKL